MGQAKLRGTFEQRRGAARRKPYRVIAWAVFRVALALAVAGAVSSVVLALAGR